VTLLLDLPPTSAPRRDCKKMMTRAATAIAALRPALLSRGERAAIEHGTWLLVLDTAVDERRFRIIRARRFKLSG